MVLENVFDRLLKFRNSKKLAKKDMAEILGCTPASYSRYENGERELGIKSLIPFYKMGCDLNWLITGQGNMENNNDNLAQSQEKEIIKSLISVNEKQSASLEYCSEALVCATKAAENLSKLLTKHQENNGAITNNKKNIVSNDKMVK